MDYWKRVAVTLCLSLVAANAVWPGRAQAAAATGSISGRVILSGPPPGNPVIRMTMDPMCGKMTAGKRVVDEIVMADRQGNLGNVFVSLRGAFPETQVPTTAVIVDQKECMYIPRVVGVRVGQSLEVHNSDQLMHNVHAFSKNGNGFNVSVPRAGMVQRFQLKNEESMLRLRCDVHRWMTSFIGVMSNDYFAVTRGDGVFRIQQVPVGTHTIQAWHERYGVVSQTVKVTAGRDTVVSFAYSGSEKAPPIADLRLP